ncbi:adenosylcobinamide-phosphate synthase CbiB [Halobacillus sp. B23F22_1]|uniref:adenosylcobinamide-phosphate synthase CbiB n=1 Tax=Halobacillus sp. B23F22_1 TaxID=3459514 RepID=UPI00373E7828
MTHLTSITLAFVLDLWLGDPRWLPHPVRLIGRMIAYFEGKWNRGNFRRIKGVVMLIVLCIVVFFLSWTIIWAGYQLHMAAGIAAETLLIWTTIASKGLKEAAMDVYIPLVERNLPKARHNLAMIVGRDTEQLNESEIARGAVETVAENTSDGITAPLFFALIGGAPLAMLYRAVNTCDSMVGYRHDRYVKFGWGSARFDDVLNWIPARVTALLLLIAEKSSHVTLRMLREQARRHPSPNSGWGEASFALLLGVQLGGKNYYFGEASYRPTIGFQRQELHAHHILESTKIMLRAVIYFLIVLWIGGILIEMASSWR